MSKTILLTSIAACLAALPLGMTAMAEPARPSPAKASPVPASRPAPPAASATPDLTRAAFIANMDSEFRKRDADGDGKVTRAELEQWERSRALAAAQTRNRELFARLDTNRDGMLSPGEFAALVKDPGPVDIGPLMARFDTNRDQVVTLVEFRAGTLANFDKLDADHDGVISAAEMKASPPPARGSGR